MTITITRSIDIEVCGLGERPVWETFVQDAPTATICHHFLWQSVIQAAYGHQSFYLLAREGKQVQGVLPLVLVKSRLFGTSLTSMPFLDYGGVCTEREDVARQLV